MYIIKHRSYDSKIFWGFMRHGSDLGKKELIILFGKSDTQRCIGGGKRTWSIENGTDVHGQKQRLHEASYVYEHTAQHTVGAARILDRQKPPIVISGCKNRH